MVRRGGRAPVQSACGVSEFELTPLRQGDHLFHTLARLGEARASTAKPSAWGSTATDAFALILPDMLAIGGGRAADTTGAGPNTALNAAAAWRL